MTTILVVEDEPLNRELLVTILESNGFEAIVADNGEDGVEVARTHRPALILMDIQMPRMDGIEATRRLKADAATRQIPIVAITAFAMREDQERIRAGGFDDYVTKPVGIDSLVEMVCRYVKP